LKKEANIAMSEKTGHTVEDIESVKHVNSILSRAKLRRVAIINEANEKKEDLADSQKLKTSTAELDALFRRRSELEKEGK